MSKKSCLQISFIVANQRLFNIINKNVINHTDGLEEKNHTIISMNEVKNLMKSNTLMARALKRLGIKAIVQ